MRLVLTSRDDESNALAGGYHCGGTLRSVKASVADFVIEKKTAPCGALFYMVGLWIVLKSVELYERELSPVLFCYFFVHVVIPHRILVKARLMKNVKDGQKIR